MISKLTLFFARTLTVLLVITILINIGSKIRWDKVPIVSFFVLEIELWSSAFDASYLKEPIKWNELDVAPSDWEEKGVGSWFSLNKYTKNLLKEYMAENNYGIVPDSWDELRLPSNFEECLEIFEFTELSEEERVPFKKNSVPKILLVIFSILSVACWILYFIFKHLC